MKTKFNKTTFHKQNIKAKLNVLRNSDKMKKFTVQYLTHVFCKILLVVW